MDSIWMAIAPRPTGTRVIAMQGAAETLLKACLSCNPAHPRALPTLLEGIALYTLDWVPEGGRRPRRNRDLSGMGDFRDLRRLVLFEVAR